MKFAVIGHPVAHSLSPAMHTANFRSIGLDAVYAAFDVLPESLEGELKRFAAEGYRGINVTVPHKQAVMPFLTRLDPSAVHIGAVNTIRFEEDGSTTGFNTDMYGFLAPLKASGFKMEGSSVVLLGAGGAARAVAVACLDSGCTSLTIVNRTRSRADALSSSLSDSRVTVSETIPSDSSLLVNATSVGLKVDDPSAFPPSAISSETIVYDLIPVARETATIALARSIGARCFGGLGMLVAQGAEAFRIWTGLEPDVAAMSNFSTFGL